MTIHVLVEGPSERELLERWAPRALGLAITVRVHPHRGKGQLPADLDAVPGPQRQGLLDQLPAKLRAFANALNLETDSVLVLVDADDDDPTALAQRIEDAAKRVAEGLRVLVRLAVEETEAFYLGDLGGLERAYPDADMAEARDYVPDSICGTWELFGRIVRDGGENKVDWAESMGATLTTVAGRSRSPSFRAFVQGIRTVASMRPKPARTKRAYRHPGKKRDEPGKRR